MIEPTVQPVETPPSLAGVVAAVAAHVDMLREEGGGAVELDRATLRELGKLSAPRAAEPRAPAPKPVPPAKPPVPPRPAIPPAPPLPATPPVTDRDRDAAAGRLAAIAAEIAGCTKCPLHRTRTQTVPGQGNPRTEILFVGEGPGRDEDLQGVAFVGRSGALLTRMIASMGMSRDEVFIANIVKCRATEDYAMVKDRAPSLEEMKTCLPYLRAQIAALQPRVIITLGNVALEGLLGIKGITRLRGQWREYEGIPLMPTYHPSFLLRGGGDETARYWEVWDDLVAVLRRIGREPPPRERKPKGA